MTWPTCPAGGYGPCTPLVTPQVTSASSTRHRGGCSPATTSCRGSRPTFRSDDERGGALEDYLASLAKVRDLDVDEIMPAHEWRFRGIAERADAIAAHHERRLAELLAVISRNPDSAPWDLAGQLTWSRSWDQYSGRMRITAVTETAAHVHELVRRGLVSARGGEVATYRVTNRPE